MTSRSSWVQDEMVLETEETATQDVTPQLVTCVNCRRSDLRRGQYCVCWYDEGEDEEFILCNSCLRVRKHEALETYVVEGGLAGYP